MRACSLLGASGLLIAVLPAQLPSHAVLLNPSGARYEPRLTHNGETVHACGITPVPNGYGFVHYARSTDGGRTWPIRELPLAYSGDLGGVAVDGDLVVVLVNSPFIGPHTITSFDGGATWSLPVRVSQQSGFNTLRGCTLHVRGTTVSVFWFENRSTGRAWCNRSVDGGMSWQPLDTVLDAGIATGSAQLMYFYQMVVVADGATQHVLWDHWAPGSIVTLYQRSTDGGVTWLPVAQILTSNLMDGAAGDGNLLFVSEFSSSNVVRSADAGATWAPLTGHGLQNPMRVAVDGLRVLVVGQVGISPSATLQCNSSADGGLTWLPAPHVMTFAGSLGAAHVIGDACFVHVRSTSQAQTGFVLQSDDGGVQWRQLGGDAGQGFWPSAASCLVTTRTSTAGDDLFAYVIEGHTSLGQGTGGTGGFVPVLEGTGLPGLGRTFALDVNGARGGSLGAYFVTFGAAANVPFGAATLYLQQPIGPFVFLTSGSVGAPGVGTASLPIAVPASTAFAGLRLLSQAFVLDPASPDGFTATRAIETWIR